MSAMFWESSLARNDGTTSTEVGILKRSCVIHRVTKSALGLVVLLSLLLEEFSSRAQGEVGGVCENCVPPTWCRHAAQSQGGAFTLDCV